MATDVLERERYYVDDGGLVRDSALDTSATERDSELDECEITDRLNSLESELARLRAELAVKDEQIEALIQSQKISKHMLDEAKREGAREMREVWAKHLPAPAAKILLSLSLSGEGDPNGE